MESSEGFWTNASDVVFYINGEKHVLDDSSGFTLSLNDYIRRKTRFKVTVADSLIRVGYER